MFDNLWVEKYRPKTLDDIVLSDKNRQFFNDIKRKQEIPHLMFHGSPGIGKSSISKILVTDILNCQYLYINASDESGIDIIRTKVTNFAHTRSIDGKLKAVILDECLEENIVVWCLRDGKQQKIKIKDLKPETDLVKSYDIKNDYVVWRPFKLIDQGYRDIYELTFENGEIIHCTETHKWYVYDKDGKIVRKSVKDIINLGIKTILTSPNLMD